jgi:hypothetical protein
MSAIDRISKDAVDRNVATIMYFMQDMKMCTQSTMGERMGMSSSMAGVYLNECVDRGLLSVGKKRPLTYSLPSRNAEVPDDPALAFEPSGKKTSMTIYVDESICAKIKALSVMKHKTMYGGQGALISDLIEGEFDKIPDTYHDALARLVEAIESAETLKSQIPKPIEWENADAQSDQD